MAESISRPISGFKGKVAVVTGAGSEGDGIGNGRAISILLAEQGADVLCVDRVQEWADRTVSMIGTEGKGRAISCAGDVTSLNDCRRIIQTAVEKFGHLDILVNNVGIGGPNGTAVEVDMDEWTNAMNVNVSSMVMMSKFAVPEMLKNDPTAQVKGVIINMGSVAGLRGGTPHLLYPTSKGAVVNMTRAMAVHHAEDGIRVNCVCPGMLYTPMMYARGMTEEARQARKNRSLLRTEGNAWDCAGAVRFLASNEARWITGVVLPIDAGTTATSSLTRLPKSASVGAASSMID